MPSDTPYSTPLLSLRDRYEDKLREWSPYLYYKLTHNVKPFNQFLNMQHVSIPKSMQEIKERTTNNLLFFNGNYMLLTLLVALLVLLFNNLYLLLAVVASIGGFVYLRSLQIVDVEFTIGGQEVVLSKKILYVLLLVVTIPMVLFNDPISSLLEIAIYSSVAVGAHCCLIEGYSTETSFNEGSV